MDQILAFLKEYSFIPVVIGLLLTVVNIVIAIFNYKINKTKFQSDLLININDFYIGLDVIRTIQKLTKKLTVKKVEDITHESIQYDKKTLELLVELLQKNEDKLKKAFVVFETLNSFREDVEELVSLIETDGPSAIPTLAKTPYF